MDSLAQQKLHAKVELELYPEDGVYFRYIERRVENLVIN